jgi:organic hydroperoxide reductase OsmC/OhrA
MEESDRFRVLAWWSSGRNGIAQSDSAPNTIHFSSPPSVGGVSGRWTPEDLFLAAIASSYTVTFRTLAENAKFVHTDLQVQVKGTLNNDGKGLDFSELRIRANLMISDPADEARALKLMHMACSQCSVTRSLAIRQTFEPVVAVAVPVS